MALPAQQLAEEQAPQETRQEAISAPETREESPVDKALEQGSEKVVGIFQGRAQEERAALTRLGLLEPQEAEAMPEAAERIEVVNQETAKKIEAAKLTALTRVEGLLGVPPAPANDVTQETAQAQPPIAVNEMPEMKAVEVRSVIAVGEAAPKTEAPVEAVKVMPTIKVGEPTPEVVVKKSEEMLEAEEQLEVADEVMRESAEALTSFCEEHHVPFDAKMLKVEDASRLTKPELFYVQTLMGKHAAGLASKKHAEKMLEAYAFSESDPRRAAVLQEAESLAKDAALKEKAALVMQQNYLNLPEISSIVGQDSGGSLGGSNFEGAESPFGPGEPQGPEEPPKTPMVGSSLYGEGGVPGSGLTKIDSYKPETAKKPERKPSFIDRWFRKQASDVTYEAVDEKSSRE